MTPHEVRNQVAGHHVWVHRPGGCLPCTLSACTRPDVCTRPPTSDSGQAQAALSDLSNHPTSPVQQFHLGPVVSSTQPDCISRTADHFDLGFLSRAYPPAQTSFAPRDRIFLLETGSRSRPDNTASQSASPRLPLYYSNHNSRHGDSRTPRRPRHEQPLRTVQAGVAR